LKKARNKHWSGRPQNRDQKPVLLNLPMLTSALDDLAKELPEAEDSVAPLAARSGACYLSAMTKTEMPNAPGRLEAGPKGFQGILRQCFWS